MELSFVCLINSCVNESAHLPRSNCFVNCLKSGYWRLYSETQTMKEIKNIFYFIDTLHHSHQNAFVGLCSGPRPQILGEVFILFFLNFIFQICCYF